MRRLSAVLFVFALALLAQSALARTWSDTTGKLKVEADLIAHSQERVVLKTAKGKLISLEVQQLSEDNCSFPPFLCVSKTSSQ